MFRCTCLHKNSTNFLICNNTEMCYCCFVRIIQFFLMAPLIRCKTKPYTQPSQFFTFREKCVQVGFTNTHTHTVPVQIQVHCDRGSLSSETGWRWGQMRYSGLDSTLGLSTSYARTCTHTHTQVIASYSHIVVYSLLTPSCKTETHQLFSPPTSLMDSCEDKHKLWKEWTLTHPRMLRQTLPLR